MQNKMSRPFNYSPPWKNFNIERLFPVVKKEDIDFLTTRSNLRKKKNSWPKI